MLHDYTLYDLESLEILMHSLQSIVNPTPQHMDLLRELMNEIHTRLGQPKGELHLTVIKGDRKPLDFELNII